MSSSFTSNSSSYLSTSTSSTAPHYHTPSPSQTPTIPTSSSNTIPSTPTTTASTTSEFRYPPHYSFPPFYNLQPNLTTRASQLSIWSSLLLAYCASHRLFQLHVSHPIFHNATLRRTLPASDAGEVLSYMEERGRATFVSSSTGTSKKAQAQAQQERERADAAAWVWWKTQDAWAGVVSGWVEDTGQKGSVLTLYELLRGDAAERTEWAGMPEEMLRMVLGVLVKKGKASVFGEEGEEAVKFY